jgi:hypothetical protein
MHIYVSIMKSLETSNPWSLEKMRHVCSQCFALNMTVCWFRVFYL